jgi:two-component system, chemotaxis family, sensor kinase CheA
MSSALKLDAKSKLKLLVVDDEPDIAEMLLSLCSDNYDGILAQSGEEALLKLKEFGSEIACVVSDFKMPGMSGLDLREAMFPQFKDIPFIVVSGFITKEHALRGVELKISAFLSKPLLQGQILMEVQKHGAERESMIRERLMLEQTFIEESSSIVEELEPLIMEMEQKPNDMETLNTIFRLVHTIKGSSGVLDSLHIRTYVHKYEDLLSKLKNGTMIATPEIVSVLLKGFDVVGQMISGLRRGEVWTKNVEELAKIFDVTQGAPAKAGDAPAAHEGSASADSAKGAAKDTVNVPAAMLEQFMELSGEITVIRNMVNKLVCVIEKEMPGNRNVQQLGDLLDEMHKINSGMQVRLTETRKVPLTKVFRSLPRTVRDTARALGKTIKLKIEGEDLRVDTSLAQALSDSLVHIVRNSLDHGIEPKEKRLERHKNPEGTILIRAVEANDQVVISIQDDGGGLNQEMIKKKAVERGLYTAGDIEKLSSQKIFSLIFESGFSTAAQVTDVSGRGVGMDMVRASIQKVKGRINIESDLGKGTTFALQMPVPKSVLIISSLVVDAAGSTFAIPQDKIARLYRLEGKRISQLIKPLEGTFVLDYEGDLIPITDLGEMLGLRPKGSMNFLKCDLQNILIVKAEHSIYALAVDQILDSEEIVVKSVGKYLEQTKVYAGATFMGDGRVGLILSADGMAEVSGVLNAQSIGASAEDELAVHVPGNNTQEILLFELWCGGLYGVSLSMIHRLEEFPRKSFQSIGGREVLIYREQTVPLIDLSNAINLTVTDKIKQTGQDPVPVFVIMIHDRYVAFLIREIKDVCLAPSELDVTVRDRDEIAGTIDVNGKVVSILDVYAILDKAGILKTFDPTGALKKLAHGLTVPTEEPVGVGPTSDLVNPEVAADSAAGFAGDGWGLF